MKNYYGFEFASTENTTTGSAHPITGRMSIAGRAVKFDTKSDRDAWVDKRAGYAEHGRAACNKKQLRGYHLGMPVAEFEEMCEYGLF